MQSKQRQPPRRPNNWVRKAFGRIGADPRGPRGSAPENTTLN